MKDLSPLKYFLGIELPGMPLVSISVNVNIVWISFRTGLSGAKAVTTPIEPNHNLYTNNGPFLPGIARYHYLVGCLIYLTITHPELA